LPRRLAPRRERATRDQSRGDAVADEHLSAARPQLDRAAWRSQPEDNVSQRPGARRDVSDLRLTTPVAVAAALHIERCLKAIYDSDRDRPVPARIIALFETSATPD